MAHTSVGFQAAAPPRRLLMTVHSAKRAGAQLVALGQARALKGDYELVFSIGHGPLRPSFDALGPVVRAPTRVPLWGASPSRWALDVARAAPDAVRLAGVIRSRRVQAVVVNSSVLVAPVLAARLAGVPVIVHAQEAPKSRAARAVFRFHGALADTVVAISPWIADAFDGARANVLLNPVGIPIPARPARPLRESRHPRLVVVGTIDRHKRQDLAVSALAAMQSHGLDAELTLVGPEADPAYAAEVRTLAKRTSVAERVHFAGQSSDVPRHLLAADALLLPAGEVTPLVIMEAMALGTPVIAARMGSVPDVVVDGSSGLLVPPDDPHAFATAVARLHRERTLARALADGARRRVEEHFNQARSHERLREEIQRLVAAHAPRRVPVASLRRPV
jgi:UDP-N-acetylglucosamine:LPS N-acetylglucosamine transferase